MEKRSPLPQGTKLYFDENSYYTIDEILGYGGSAIIYSAHKTINEVNYYVRYAIKECYPWGNNYARVNGVVDIVEKDDEAIESFEKIKKLLANEMKNGWEVGINNAFAEVMHEQIVIRKIEVPKGDVYTDTDTGIFYCMMSLKGKGYTLDQVLEYYKAVGELTLNNCLQILNKILTAVDKLHHRPEEQYMHGDIHPNNIFFIGTEFEKNELGICSLLDFACVRKLNKGTKQTDVICDDIFTTESYAAPEIVRWIPGEEFCLSAATDVYSLGMLFWYILNGGRFKGAKLKYRKPYLLPGTAKKLNAKTFVNRVNELLCTATAYEPEERYHDARDMQNAIQSLLVDTTPLVHRVNAEIPYPTDFNNRQKDLANIDRILERRNNPLFLWGMGGIGKTILSSMYGQKRKEEGCEVIFLTYKNSIKDTILSLHISGDNEWERCGELLSTNDEQYVKKLGYLSQYSSKSLLILDDFYDENRDLGEMKADENYKDLLSLNIKLLITTRYECTPEDGYHVVRMSNEELLALLKPKLSKDEAKDEKKLLEIIECVSGNTYMLELIGAALKEGTLELDEAISVFKDGSEQVKASTGKDMDFLPRSIDEQMEILFEINALDDNEKRVLVHSLIFPTTGMRGKMFLACEKMFSDEMLEAATKLVRKSWIIKNQELGIYTIHPTVRMLVNKKCTNIEVEKIAFLWKFSLYLESKGISSVSYRECYRNVFDSTNVFKSRELLDSMYAFANGYYAVARKIWEEADKFYKGTEENQNYGDVFGVVCEILTEANVRLHEYRNGICKLRTFAENTYKSDGNIHEKSYRYMHRNIFKLTDYMSIPDIISLFAEFRWADSEERVNEIKKYDVWKEYFYTLNEDDFGFSFDLTAVLQEEPEWLDGLVNAMLSESTVDMVQFVEKHAAEIPKAIYSLVNTIVDVRNGVANRKKIVDVLERELCEEPDILRTLENKLYERSSLFKQFKVFASLGYKLNLSIFTELFEGYVGFLQLGEFDCREMIRTIMDESSTNLPQEYIELCISYYELSKNCADRKKVELRDKYYGRIIEVLNDYKKFSLSGTYYEIGMQYLQWACDKCSYEKATNFFNECKKYWKEKDEFYALLCRELGNAYSTPQLDQKQKALNEYMEAYDILYGINSGNVGRLAKKIAKVFQDIGEREQAIYYYEEYLKEYDNIHFDVYSYERNEALWELVQLVASDISRDKRSGARHYKDVQKVLNYTKEYAQTVDKRYLAENEKRLWELYIILGEYYEKCKDYVRAINYYRESIYVRKITGLKYYHLALKFHEVKLYQEERECCEKAILELQKEIDKYEKKKETWAGAVITYYAAFRISLMLKKCEDADLYSQRCATEFEKEPWYYIYMGHPEWLCYYMKKNYLEEIANVYKEVGNYQKAIDYYERMLMLKVSLGNMAHALYKRFTVILTYLNMGECYLGLNDKRNAYECYLRGLNMEWDNLPEEDIDCEFYNRRLEDIYEPCIKKIEICDDNSYRDMREIYISMFDKLVYVRNYKLASTYLQRMLDSLNASLRQERVDLEFTFKSEYVGADSEELFTQLKELRSAYYITKEFFQENGKPEEALDYIDVYNRLSKYINILMKN